MKISVITPTLNTEEYIENAIISVLDQNYDNFEHIIIDGCSTDKTLDIIKKYPHIKWISEKDTGLSNAMNKGFELSTGDIIVYLNSDDYFLKNAFNKVEKYFIRGYKFVVGDIKIIDLNGQEIIVSPNIEHNNMLYHWKKREYIDTKHAKSSFPNNPVQYFYIREVQEKIKFNELNRNSMDLEFLLECSKNYSFKKMDYVLGVYVVRQGSIAVSAKNSDSYWSIENFKYLDQYLTNWEYEEIIKYKNSQIKAYMENILKKKNLLLKNQSNTIKNREKTIVGKIKLIEVYEKKIINFFKFIDNSNIFKFLFKFNFIKNNFEKLRIIIDKK